MGTHIIIGAGGIGRTTAALLASAGHEVVLASRSGPTAAPDGVRTAAVDAASADALVDLAQGADSLVNAVNPSKYTRWATDWPPVAAAMLTAAEKTGAGLVSVSNLYGYGPVSGPITRSLPLAATGTKGRIRASMWAEALEAHDAGRLRATELRASDYFGAAARPGVSYLNDFVLRRAATRRSVWLPVGRVDVPHSWTYLPDIAALAAALASDDRSWGEAWHVPTAPARSVREVVADVAGLTGDDPVPVRRLPAPARAALRALPVVRELDETAHQFENPWVLDSTAAQETFGLGPTPWASALEATLRTWR